MHKRLAEWAIPFAAWELRLYLDTHPDDTNALAAYKQICAAIGGGYACEMQSMQNGGGMSCPISQDKWNWIDGPWPWQTEANQVDKED